MEKENEKDMIQVPRKDLEEVVNKIKELEKSREEDKRTISKMIDDNKMLLSIADKKRLADYEIKNNNGSLTKTAKVWLFDDKFIIGWKMVRNRVVANLHRNIVEAEQTIELVLKNATKPEEPEEKRIVLYKEFIDQKVSKEGEVVRVVSEEDATFYKIQFSDGLEIEIDVKFLN